MKNRKGFSLIELLVVVMIITILSTVVAVNLLKEPGKARTATAKAQISTFKTALELYRRDHGTLPTREQGLQALCQVPTDPPVPENYPPEGYLDVIVLPVDPWGNPYAYMVPGTHGEGYEIITYGADNEPGGEGENADISSSIM